MAPHLDDDAEQLALHRGGQGVVHGAEDEASLRDLIFAALGHTDSAERFEQVVLKTIATELLVLEHCLRQPDDHPELASDVIADFVAALALRARCAAELGRRMRRAARSEPSV